jgi:hypothetical protein
VSLPAPRSPGADARTQAPAAPDRIVPIGRPVTSGPDTAERQYADADPGNSWFSTKTSTKPDEAAPVPPQRTGDKQPTATGANPPATAPDAARSLPVDTDGVVIDLDITGLFHGYGVTAEQALIVAREEAGTKPAEEAGTTAEAATKYAEKV